MSLPNLDPSQKPDMLFKNISAYVAQVEAQVDARGEVDLSGLDVAVRALCDGVMQLPVGEAKEYNAKLKKLMEAIETMQAKMVKLQSEIATAMKGLGKQKKAHQAYTNTPKADK